MLTAPVICEVRYYIDYDAVDRFKVYAQTWMELIVRYGGTHYGYFISRSGPVGAPVSFPGIGIEETSSIAVARFAFSDDAAYLRYRDQVGKDPDGIEANSRYGHNPPFIRYERIFLEKLL